MRDLVKNDQLNGQVLLEAKNEIFFEAKKED